MAKPVSILDKQPGASTGVIPDDTSFLFSVLGASLDCIKILNLDAELLAMTENGQRALEIDELTPFLGTCWTDWWHGADRQAATAAIADAKAGNIGHFQAAATTAKGTMKWWDVTITAIPGPDGKPAKLLSVSRDISAERAISDAAAERLDQLQSIIASAKDYAVISMDASGAITDWSIGAELTFGHFKQEMIGQDFSKIFTQEDRAAEVPHGELQTARQQGVAPDNRWHKHAGGKRIFVQGATRPIHNAVGELTGYVKVCRDITDNQTQADALADARIRLDLARIASGTATWLIDISTGQVFGDNSMAKLYGLPYTPEGQSKPMEDFIRVIHPEDQPVVREYLAKTVAIDGGENFNIEHRILRTDQERHLLVRGRVERDLQGKAVRLAGASVDVTDRTQAEQERARLAEQHRLALDAADMGWWHLDAAKGEVITDRRCRQIFGIAGERLEYQNVIDLMHPDDRSRVNAAVQAATRVDNPQPYAIDYRLKHPDGSVTWIRTRGKAYYAGTGSARRFTSFVGTVADITLERTANEALRQSEFELRRLADSMPQIVWAARPDGTVDYYNRRWYEYTGLPEGEIGNASWEPVIAEEDLARIVPIWEESVRTGGPHGLECRYRRASDGMYRWHLSRANPIRDEHGDVIRWFGTNTDIHDQKIATDALREGREQLAVALAAGGLGTWQIELPSLEMSCSDACKVYCGREINQPFTYEMALESIYPDDRAPTKSVVQKAIHEHEDFVAEYRVIWPDASLHWAAVHGRVVYDKQGAPIRIAGVVQDITKRKTADDDREHLLAAERAARTESEQAGRMKDEFLATLSHELRTPLNAIVGWTQILKTSGGDPEDLAEGLSVIDRNARAQTQIIEDVLDMSRIISGKIRLDIQQVNLASLVQAGADTVLPAAQARGVQVQVKLDPTVGFISADPSRLHQVFWNLLSNAVKFTPRGGRVHMTLERVNSHVEVSVTDTGEGIEPAFLPYVFDRFRQADATITRKHGGLGLGLSIVKQLVELHGGSVRVKSPGKNQGATFVVALPSGMVQTPQAEPALSTGPITTEISVNEHSAACGELHGLTVIVVDDEPDGRLMVKRLLEECGAIVRAGASALEGLKLLSEEIPTVLISDIGMPGEDGYSFIRRVRQLPPEKGGSIPAIALTAFSRAADRIRALEAGFQMHLSKPVEPAELIVTIATIARNQPNGNHQPSNS